MSHTGNATGNFGIQGPKGSRVLTPFVAAQNLKSVLHCWYNADFLQIDSDGLVSGATDLTGRGNHGAQSNAANRLTYFPSDSMFSGKPSLGSADNLGAKHIITGTTTLTRAICSAYYKSGVESTFSDVVGIFSAVATSIRVLSNTAGTSNWQAMLTSGTYSRNGSGNVASTTTTLPLPASTLIFNSSIVETERAWQFGYNAQAANRTWPGGFRNLILVPGAISSAQIALIEGVMAWDGGHQNRLVSTHPYRFIPPSIGD